MNKQQKIEQLDRMCDALEQQMDEIDRIAVDTERPDYEKDQYSKLVKQYNEIRRWTLAVVNQKVSPDEKFEFNKLDDLLSQVNTQIGD